MLTLANFDQYDGMWEADAKHGEGTYYYEVRRGG